MFRFEMDITTDSASFSVRTNSLGQIKTVHDFITQMEEENWKDAALIDAEFDAQDEAETEEFDEEEYEIEYDEEGYAWIYDEDTESWYWYDETDDAWYLYEEEESDEADEAEEAEESEEE